MRSMQLFSRLQSVQSQVKQRMKGKQCYRSAMSCLIRLCAFLAFLQLAGMLCGLAFVIGTCLAWVASKGRGGCSVALYVFFSQNRGTRYPQECRYALIQRKWERARKRSRVKGLSGSTNKVLNAQFPLWSIYFKCHGEVEGYKIPCLH